MASSTGLNDTEFWTALQMQLSSAVEALIGSKVMEAKNAWEAEFTEQVAELHKQEKAIESARTVLEVMQAELAKDREALATDREMFEEERRKMSEGRSMDDLITLNIGGEKTVTVKRGTLCAIGDSMLAASFSGRWDESLQRDSDGAIFVDFEPDLFMPLLAYLRMKRIESPEIFRGFPAGSVLPTVQGREVEFQAMLNFYGLDGTVSECRESFSFKFSIPSPDISFKDDGLAAVRLSLSQASWRRAISRTSLDVLALAAPIAIRFQVVQLGFFHSDRHRTRLKTAPHVGVALQTLDWLCEQSEVRNPEGVWAYSAGSGFLMAPEPEYIVGPQQRRPASKGDVVSLIVYPDRRMGLKLNSEDLGIIFRNLPHLVRPVVEMDAVHCEIRIVQ